MGDLRDTLEVTFSQLIATAQFSIAHNYAIPALTLIYSGMDSAAWLAASDDQPSVRDRFTWWVDTYVLSRSQLPCTALDLYAARCAILHTFTAESHLSRSQRASKIYYRSSVAPFPELMEAAFKTAFREEGAVEIVLPDLLEAFAGGVAAMMDGTITDDLLRDRISRRAASYFRFVTPADLEPGDPGDAA